VRFQRRLSLDEVEQAIDRLERAIKGPYPSVQHLYLESGALNRQRIQRLERHPWFNPEAASRRRWEALSRGATVVSTVTPA